MKITKFAQSCLLVEEGNAKILIDPGSYSTAQNDVGNLDVVLITQTHQDHFDINSVKAIVAKNPQAKIFTNHEVREKLKEVGIKSELLEHAQKTEVKGVTIEAFGKKHELIYPGWPEVVNTGYLIAGRLFHPGDGFYVPEKPVEILALPVLAPWLKSSEAVDYAKKVKPKISFPIHDALLKSGGMFHGLPEKLLVPESIQWVVIAEGETKEF